MASKFEQFWDKKSYALIGHNQNRDFPTLTLKGLLNSSKTVYAIDSSISKIEGEKTYSSLSDLPQPVDAAIIEVAKSETAAKVQEVSDAGIKNLWIHLGTDTPEAIAIAQKANINLCYGTCAVMYVNGTGLHKFHGWINKLLKKY